MRCPSGLSLPGAGARRCAVRATGATGATGATARFAPPCGLESPAFLRLTAYPTATVVRASGATGCDGQVRTLRGTKVQESRGFQAVSATGKCELRTRNRALSLAKYRAAPPGTRSGPRRTRDLSHLADAAAERRTFRSPSRPTEISTKTSAQRFPKAKQPAPGTGGAAKRTLFKLAGGYILRWTLVKCLSVATAPSSAGASGLGGGESDQRIPIGSWRGPCD
jgi:hypothetical protein